MAEPDSVLIYDGDCPFCSAASTALRRVDDVGVVPRSDDAARAFLAAQFGDPPFALVLVDGEARRVHAGRDAARELCDRAGLPVLVRDIVGENYESVADAVRTVSGADREADAYHGTFDLTADAASALRTLVEAAETPAARRHVDIG